MKCLRCGTELKDSTVFCSECNKVTSVPLPSSPYMSKKIILPKRTASQSTKKQEAKKPVKKESRTGPWVLTTLLLLLLSGVLLLQGTYIYKEKLRLSGELSRLQTVENECVRLTELLRQSEEEVSALEEELSELASGSYLEVREDLKEAQSTIQTLTADLARAKEAQSALEARLELLLEKTDFLDSHIVFLQDDNTNVFHSYDCEKFTHHGYRAYNKQQALSLGYTPCPDCQINP